MLEEVPTLPELNGSSKEDVYREGTHHAHRALATHEIESLQVGSVERTAHNR